MSDLKELIERELESFIEWDGDDKSIVTTTSAKLFAEHVAKIYADHVAGARKMVAAVQGEPLRYTNDGALAECPCCGSLDVGGAHDTVHCYSCDLTVTKPRPLQNAIDAWNTRTGRTHPAPAVQGEPVGEVRFELGAPSSIFAELYSKSLPALAPGTKLYATPQPAKQQPFEWPRLDRPAKVGAGRFGKGVSSRLVIEAAQRQYEYDVTPEKEAERIAKFADFRKEVLQPVLAVAGLMQALESAKNLIANHSGEVLPDEYAGDQIEQIDAALSAYRRGGGK